MKVLALAVTLAVMVSFAEAADKIVFCYYGSWAVYRPGQGKMEVTDVDPNLCTHFGYTFVGMNAADGKVVLLDPWHDLGKDGGLDGFGKLKALKKINPKLKTILVVGGWNEGSTKYSQMAKDQKKRATFVSSAVQMCKEYGFDGFDLDWEYPGQREGDLANDKKNYNLLVKELKQALSKEGLSLSAAVAATAGSASISYDIAEIAKHFDFINVMTYDLHGDWDKKTGHNAPLASNDGLNIKAAVEYWLKQGLPASKLVLGLASYGRSFTLNNPSNTGINSPASNKGAAGPYTREPGMLGYNEICEKVLKSGWTVVRDETAKVPYAFNANQWVGFDDVQSIGEKVKYANELKLAGVMLWSIETDDFRGNCGEKYPILNAIKKTLSGGQIATGITSDPNRPTVKVTEPTKPSNNPTQPSNGSNNGNNNNNGSNNGNSNSSGKIDCSTMEGYFADRDDCTIFYRCVEGVQFGPMNCPAGLKFDERASTCNWATEVQC